MERIRLQEDILDILIGTADGKESISYTMSSLKERGWRRLGRLWEFKMLVQELGFTVEPVYRKRKNPDGSAPIIRENVTL